VYLEEEQEKETGEIN